jgi:ketosteroid isomerase-like protein
MSISQIAVFAMCCGFVAASPASAEQWSPAQTDVWKNVEAYSAMSAAGDVQGFLAYVHDSYIGWDVSDPLTSSKSRLRKFLDYNSRTYKTELADMQPVAINIVDDVAIVHYYFTIVTKDADGKRSYDSGRWTDVLKKQGDKWVLIGDHGGVTSSEE